MAEAAPAASTESPQLDRRVFLGLGLSAASLIGLVFPPAIGLAIAGIVVAFQERRRIASSAGRLRGAAWAWVAIVVGVLGCLLSLAIPGFVVYAWVYAIFHGGKLPFYS